MPKALERKLEKQAEKKGYKGERKNKYVYGTMTKMGWKKGMSEEEMTHMMSSMRKKAIGVACLLAVLLGSVVLAVTPPTTFVGNPNRANNQRGDRLYDLGFFTRETVDVPETSSPAYATVCRFIPWIAFGASDTLGYRAMYVKVVATQGDGIRVRAFGPGVIGSNPTRVTEDVISASSDSVAVETSFPVAVDSLWLWDVSGTTSRARIVCF